MSIRKIYCAGPPFKVRFDGGSEMRMSADELVMVEGERMSREVGR